MDIKQALYNYCVRIGDNNLILGQRLAEWCSFGPILEEDLAMTNISLDCFGQAEFMYEYAAELEANGRCGDDIAFRRNEREYYNNLLVEQPNGDFAVTMIRQLLYSAFAKYFYEALSASNDERLSALAARALKEAKYHYRHSSEWVIRLGNGTDESLLRVQNAINELWRFTGNLFEMNQTDHALLELGIAADLNDVNEKWKVDVGGVLLASNITIPENTFMHKGGTDGMHTEHLGHILCEMQYLQRAYPDAKW